MKPCLHCKETKPLDMFYKHNKMADGHVNVCKTCRNAYVNKWNNDNRLAKRKIARESGRKNYNREKRAKSYNKWYQTTAKENGGYLKMLDRNIKRTRLISKESTPAWANDFFMKEIYELAQLRTQMTGVKHQVDHIVPLNSS